MHSFKLTRPKGFLLLLFGLFFSGNVFAGWVTVTADFYGTARWIGLENALAKAKDHAYQRAYLEGYRTCTFVGYQWYRPDFYNPNLYEVTAAYTCTKQRLG
ncbi:hypothetical protein [Pseudomonas sp. Hp2]|uniref:hypothetical protein n=1 Tax=Pseudomonas sp. Hp2 TaxID=701189 RepID=UPI00112788D7|nr:hypothetical protein [Pseudomonas sp. Hp2]